MAANILVVDDDELILRMLEKALQQGNYQVFTTTDPLQAVQWLDETSFDVAVLDVKMPQMSGLKLLEQIKAQDETIEVVILTGTERFETALEALRLGAHDFLLKPMRNIEDLLSAVERALEKRRLAFNLKQLSRGLEQMSHTDTLTGLSNRRHFFDWLAQEFGRIDRYQRPIGCLLVAVDRFEETRRERGPQCGDYLVSEVARLLKRTTRSSDRLGRYGGNEFIIALPETDRTTALAAAEKVRRTVEAHAFSFGGKKFSMTVSIGVAHLKSSTSVGALTGLVLKALEEAQQAGGNSVQLRLDEPEPKNDPQLDVVES